jgi:hypothetical protein
MFMSPRDNEGDDLIQLLAEIDTLRAQLETQWDDLERRKKDLFQRWWDMEGRHRDLLNQLQASAAQ